MKTPVLETQRLILRPVTLEDAPAIQKYFNNWNIIQHLTLAAPWPYPDDGAERFLRDVALPAMARGKSWTWVITVKPDPECVGLLGFQLHDDPKMGNRGFWLAQHLHGRGYMSEAVTVTNDFIFYDLGIERFIVKNALSNPTSRRVKEKTGGVFIGLDENSPHRSGDNVSEIWEMTRENWERVRKSGGED